MEKMVKGHYVEWMNTKLIESVKARPVLYDTGFINYKFPQLRCTAWKEVAKEMQMSEDDCRKAWNNLRDGYRRVLRRSLVNGRFKGKVWRYMKQMSFLTSHIRSEILKTSGNKTKPNSRLTTVTEKVPRKKSKEPKNSNVEKKSKESNIAEAPLAVLQPPSTANELSKKSGILIIPLAQQAGEKTNQPQPCIQNQQQSIPQAECSVATVPEHSPKYSNITRQSIVPATAMSSAVTPCSLVHDSITTLAAEPTPTVSASHVDNALPQPVPKAPDDWKRSCTAVMIDDDEDIDYFGKMIASTIKKFKPCVRTIAKSNIYWMVASLQLQNGFQCCHSH